MCAGNEGYLGRLDAELDETMRGLPVAPAAEAPDGADETANVEMRRVDTLRASVSTDLGFLLRRAVYPRSLPAVSGSFRSAARSSGTASTIKVQTMSSSMCR